MGCFRRMVAIIETTSIRSVLWAVALDLWGRDAMRRRRASTVRLFHLLTLLVIRRWLGVKVVTIFPFTMTLGGSGWRSLIPFPRGRFSSRECRRWSWSSAGNPAGRRRVRMVLIGWLVAISGGNSSILHNGTDLGWGACHAATIWWKRALIRGAIQTSRWGRRWSRQISSMRTVIRV